MFVRGTKRIVRGFVVRSFSSRLHESTTLCSQDRVLGLLPWRACAVLADNNRETPIRAVTRGRRTCRRDPWPVLSQESPSDAAIQHQLRSHLSLLQHYQAMSLERDQPRAISDLCPAPPSALSYPSEYIPSSHPLTTYVVDPETAGGHSEVLLTTSTKPETRWL